MCAMIARLFNSDNYFDEIAWAERTRRRWDPVSGENRLGIPTTFGTYNYAQVAYLAERALLDIKIWGGPPIAEGTSCVV